MEYPVQRMKKVYDETKDEKVHLLESVHHVRRCKSESCRTCWNCDILRSCNIRMQSDHGLRNVHVDPEFLGIPKAKKRTSTFKGGKRVALVKKPERSPEVLILDKTECNGYLKKDNDYDYDGRSTIEHQCASAFM